jgi:hypothetical protein
MKFIKLFIFSYLGIILILFIFLSVTTLTVEKNKIENSVLDSISTISHSKAERVGNFILDTKKKLEYFSNKEGVLEVFESNFSNELVLLEEQIKRISQNTAKEIEDYLYLYPEMTLNDLKNSEEFNKIAVQDVGETGYTYVNSRFEGVLEFHPDPKAIGLKYDVWKERFPLIWEYNEKVAQSVPCQDSSGFYDWEDINGNIRKKFTYHTCINGKTKDNYSFYVGASTYLDELNSMIEFAGTINDEFLLFQHLNGYLDMSLVDLSGQIIWTAERKNDLGTNIINGRYNDTIFSELYLDIKENKKFKISDPDYYIFENKSVIFVGSPILDYSKNLLGVSLFQFDIDLIKSSITDISFVQDYGESFILDSFGNPITSLEFGNKNLYDFYFDQLNSCIQNQTESIIYKNYQGVIVFGSYHKIPNSDWCLFVEISKKEFFENYLNFWSFGGRGIIYLVVILFFLFIFLGVILDKYFIFRRVKK